MESPPSFHVSWYYRYCTYPSNHSSIILFSGKISPITCRSRATHLHGNVYIYLHSSRVSCLQHRTTFLLPLRHPLACGTKLRYRADDPRARGAPGVMHSLCNIIIGDLQLLHLTETTMLEQYPLLLRTRPVEEGLAYPVVLAAAASGPGRPVPSASPADALLRTLAVLRAIAVVAGLLDLQSALSLEDHHQRRLRGQRPTARGLQQLQQLP